MKKKLKRSNEFLNQEDLFELANFSTKITGLPMIVYVSGKQSSHAARIKVARTYKKNFIAGDTFSMSVSDRPKIVAGDQGDIEEVDLVQVKEWIILNKEALLKYWNLKISTDELIEVLKKV